MGYAFYYGGKRDKVRVISSQAFVGKREDALLGIPLKRKTNDTFEELNIPMKSFDIPEFYKSPFISKVKAARKLGDPRKKDFSPSIVDFGELEISLARHFGFCYGVENAIEISYRALEEHPDKQVYLLSQMIHNQEVNADLEDRGIQFLMDTQGKRLIPFSVLKADDVVIIPAFGTTVETQKELESIGVKVEQYNTTCPFVEKVWKRAAKLGEDQYSIVIHGKPSHEETRATFSHSKENGGAMVIQDMAEAHLLGAFIRGERPWTEFDSVFEGRYSDGFQPEKDLQKLGVVNQTTMLATETQAIADYLKNVMIGVYGEEAYKTHFADTRDTLCYATNDNQQATIGILEEGADIAIVVGGYNSSNTSHLVELCEEKLPTYFVKNEHELISKELIAHFDWRNKETKSTSNWWPKREKPRFIVTSGASCPDAVVDRVIQKILAFGKVSTSIEEVLRTSFVKEA